MHSALLEHWTISNGMKFNKGNCWVLQLGGNTAGHRHRLGNEWLESSSARRDLGVLVESRLNVSCSVPWHLRGQTAFGVH